MIDRITKRFFDSGKSFEEFLEDATEDEAKRMALYYTKIEKKFPREIFRIDLNYEINLVVAATTWCWDSQTNVPVLVHIANNSPNINLKIFNKDDLPFLVAKINNGEKIPQVLLYTKDYYFLDRWVERSTKAYELFAEMRKKYGWKEETKD
ncbi:MAG: thioredoxin family protein [Candidatus Hodarchaeales archaeon]|jgi:predicted nucleotide-binding protein (sugar kinase/HSP70/actin superfamily)